MLYQPIIQLIKYFVLVSFCTPKYKKFISNINFNDFIDNPSMIRPTQDQGKNDKQRKKRLTGRVKWFNNAKGYGFIKREDEEKDIFVKN